MMTDTQDTGADTTQTGVQADADPKAGGTTDPAKAGAGNADPKAGDTKPEADAAGEVKYDFKVPDGFELDEPLAAEFTTIAKELKIAPEGAQKLVSLYAQREAARAEAHVNLVKSWAEEVKADKEIGGDNLSASLTAAKKAIDLGPPELKALLNSTGMGNHPAVVRWAVAVGKALSEDTIRTGGPSAQPKSIAESLYGKSTT